MTSSSAPENSNAIGNGAREAALKFDRQQARFSRRYVIPFLLAVTLFQIVCVSMDVAALTGFRFWLAAVTLAGLIGCHSMLVYGVTAGWFEDGGELQGKKDRV